MRCNIIKYILLISFFFISNGWAQVSKVDLNDALAQTFSNLSSMSTVSYNITITTLEANNITNTYKAHVNEVWQDNSYYALYKLSSNQLLFTYNNFLGIERFWFGRVIDLPEVKLKDIDTKFLNTAISYSNLTINPLWLSIPVDSRWDQGFLVIQSYNRNKLSNFSKIEYYLNKDNIPVRILYYNNISNFPVVEILVNNYKKIGNNYILDKIEYKDNTTKKTTIIEKTDIVLNQDVPEWFEDTKALINNNLNIYSNFFLLATRKDSEVSKINLKEKKAFSNDNTIKESETKVNKSLENIDTDNNTLNNKTNSYIENKQKNDNDRLLKALNEDYPLFKEEDTVLEAPNKVIAIPKIKKEVNKSRANQKDKAITKKVDSKKKTIEKPKNKNVTSNNKLEQAKDNKNTSNNDIKNSLPQENKELIFPGPKESLKDEKNNKKTEESLSDIIPHFQGTDDTEKKKPTKNKKMLNNLF